MQAEGGKLCSFPECCILYNSQGYPDPQEQISFGSQKMGNIGGISVSS